MRNAVPCKKRKDGATSVVPWRGERVGQPPDNIVTVLLVIFGAGASYDSVAQLPPTPPYRREIPAYEADRPPLANQLFEDRKEFVEAMDKFSTCKQVVHRLRGEKVVVERELAKIQKEAEEYPDAHRELAAIRYYLHLALWECQKRWDKLHHGITNYVALLREIERWRYEIKEPVCFVTFNYDTMLEDALGQVLGFHVQSIDSYISWENYALIKLHGSVNWGQEIDGIDPGSIDHPNKLIDAAASPDLMKISDRYRLVTQYPVLREGDCLACPAISIPVQNKDKFSCPGSHLQKLAETLPKVTKIITIGWRATEEDFLNMLRYRLTGLQKAQSVMIVSGSPDGAEETFRSLTKQPMTYTGCERVEDGFSGLINNVGLLDEFLRQ